MFEGKNIHFSPVDNKPLCSFSNKLCRQRRLNGYAFCIRHILEDKSAPFKRCTYVTRNNNQICQNAIPTNQERGYCHSHMQVAGIIPKTERKTKIPVAKNDSNNAGHASNKTENNNNSSSNNVKKDPNAVFKFEEDISEIQWIPKGGSINGIVNGGKTIISKGKDLQTLSKEINGGTKNGIATYNGIQTIGKKVETKNGKVAQTTLNTDSINEDLSLGKGGKSRQTYSKKNPPAKCNLNSNSKPISKCVEAQVNGKIYDRCKVVASKSKENNITTELKDVVEVPPCFSEHETYFEQLKTLKIVEKSVVKSHADSDGTSNSSVEDAKGINTNSIKTIVSIPPNHKINQDFKPTIYFRNGLVSKSGQLIGPESLWKLPDVCKNSLGETRQEFLCRVRQAFKLQYLRIKNATAENEKNEKVWKRALRNSLLTCVVKNPSFCAHFLVQNDPSQYSKITSSNTQYGTGESYLSSTLSNNGITTITNSFKHKRSSTKNGTIKNIKKVKKCDSTTEDSFNNESSKHKTQNGIQSNNIKFSSDLQKTNEIIDTKVSNSHSVEKSISKVSKLSKGSKSIGIGNELTKNNNQSHLIPKRKPRKSTTVTPNAIDLLNGINGIHNSKEAVIDKSSTNSMYSNCKNYSSSDYSNRVNESIHVVSKKMKFDIINESERNNDGMDCTSTFRVPKLEESSSNFHNSIDINIKMENESHLANSFHNAQKISNHLQFHPTNTTSLATAQLHLQHLLNQPDLRTLATHRNLGIDTVLNSVGSSDLGNSDSVITDASFDSTFDHSASSQQDCEFSDDELGKSLEFQLDPEIESQASRLLEENELTEDLNELFPDSRIGDTKLGRSDLSDLGIDFSSFDANDVLFGNIFSFTRSNQSESISVTNQF